MSICQTHRAPRYWSQKQSHACRDTHMHTLIGCELLIWTCQLRDSADRHCGKRKDILLLLCYAWLPRPCSPESFHFLNVYRAMPNNALRQREEPQELMDAGWVVGYSHEGWKDIERHRRPWELEKREREMETKGGKWEGKKKSKNLPSQAICICISGVPF